MAYDLRLTSNSRLASNSGLVSNLRSASNLRLAYKLRLQGYGNDSVDFLNCKLEEYLTTESFFSNILQTLCGSSGWKCHLPDLDRDILRCIEMYWDILRYIEI